MEEVRAERSAQALSAVVWSMLGNVLLAVIKFLAGWLGNSYALIADAIESTSDVFSSILLAWGIRVARKPADADHPYGHGRAETLATAAVACILAISALGIAYQSVLHIQTPHEIPDAFTLFVLGGIILYKEALFQWLMRKSRITGSPALVAEAWHHRSDALTSVAAFGGIAIARWMGPGYEAADDWAALGASAIILFNAYSMLRGILGEFMDEHVHEDLIHQIEAIAQRVHGVERIEKCHARKSGMHFWVDMHASVNGQLSVREGHEIANAIEAIVCREIPEVAQVLVHIEPSLQA
jgi:cation diffusion facilitator family transporter